MPNDGARQAALRTVVWRDRRFNERQRTPMIITADVTRDDLRDLLAGAVDIDAEHVEILDVEPAVITPAGRVTRPPRTRHTDMPQSDWPDDVEGMQKLIKLMMDRRWRVRDSHPDVAARMDTALVQARKKLDLLKDQDLLRQQTPPAQTRGRRREP